jgi:hypothetical protein
MCFEIARLWQIVPNCLHSMFTQSIRINKNWSVNFICLSESTFPTSAYLNFIITKCNYNKMKKKNCFLGFFFYHNEMLLNRMTIADTMLHGASFNQLYTFFFSSTMMFFLVWPCCADQTHDLWHNRQAIYFTVTYQLWCVEGCTSF